MKIKRMNINEYGCILKKEINFGDGISIIRGDNESGKSTTHQAILALMFGYLNQGKRKTFKLSPKARAFTGGYPRIDAECADDSGEYYVSRYFEGASPKATVAQGGKIAESENEPLDMFKGISRETYQGIYSLDIDQIVALKESWEREQDSILGGLYPDFLLSNEKITDNIDNRIKEVWKGKTATKLTKAKEMEDEITEQKKRLSEAIEAQDRIRDLEKQSEETEESISSCETDIEKLAKDNIEKKRQLDFYKEYSQINSVLIETDGIEKYKDVPRDTYMYYEDVENKIKSQEQKAKDKKKRRQQLKEITDKFLQQRGEMELAADLVPRAESMTAALEGVKSTMVRDEDREKNKRFQIDMKVKRLFTNGFMWDDFKQLLRVNIADCLALLDKLYYLNEEKAKLSQKIFEAKKPEKKSFFEKLDSTDYLLIAAGVIGVLMIFVPLGINRTVSITAGALLLAGSTAVSYFKKPKEEEEIPDDENTAELRRIDGEYDRAILSLQAKLDYSFIPEEKRKRPDKSLVEAIAQLQDDYIEYTRFSEEVEKDRAKRRKKLDEITNISMEVLGRSGGYESDTAQMRSKLEGMLKLEGDALAARRETAMLTEQLGEIEGNILQAKDKLKALNEALYDIAGTDIAGKADTLKAMRDAHQAAKSRENLLVKKYEDYDELQKKAGKSLDAKVFDLQTSTRKNQTLLEERGQDLQKLNEKKGELKSGMETLVSNGQFPAEIEGIIADLKLEKRKRVRLRDEYALCYGLIQKARDKFISDFNPKFLNTASRYLSTITDGRYDKIRLSEKGTSIMVMQESSRAFDFETIDSTISRGTREQIYLALRLAMLERFDPQGDRLPIVLDEALVNWDAVRFKKLMEIIDKIAKDRQVFIFTCHDYVVNTVKEISENYRLIDI